MRRPLAVLALALLALSVASPGIEAVAGCLELCPDETPGQDQCSSDACCSCCVHSGPLFASRPPPATRLALAGSTAPPAPAAPPPARSSDILHVPKPVTS
jgi:hypothetical protein